MYAYFKTVVDIVFIAEIADEYFKVFRENWMAKWVHGDVS